MLDILESETLPSSKRIVEIVVDDRTDTFAALLSIFDKRLATIFTSRTSAFYPGTFQNLDTEFMTLAFSDKMNQEVLYHAIKEMALARTEIVLETFSWLILCNDTREASKIVRRLNSVGVKENRNIYIVNQLRYNIQKYPVRIDGEDVPALIPLYETEIYPYLRGRILVKSDMSEDDMNHHQKMVLDYVAPSGYTKPRGLLSLIENLEETKGGTL